MPSDFSLSLMSWAALEMLYKPSNKSCASLGLSDKSTWYLQRGGVKRLFCHISTFFRKVHSEAIKTDESANIQQNPREIAAENRLSLSEFLWYFRLLFIIRTLLLCGGKRQS